MWRKLAHEIEVRTEQSLSAFIQEVEQIVAYPLAPWSGIIQGNGGFLDHLVGNNLRHSVAHRLAASPCIQERSSIHLLSVALRNMPNLGQVALDLEMVKLLLSKGAKPNENLSFTSTVWTEFMATVNKPVVTVQRSRQSLVATLELLIATLELLIWYPQNPLRLDASPSDPNRGLHDSTSAMPSLTATVAAKLKSSCRIANILVQ